jgi:lipopolysaccharide export system ATP-binding protein
MTALALNDLVKHFNGRTVVNHVSLTIDNGQVVGLLGPNGAGKTTTFHITVGLIRPESGQVTLDGQNITADPMYLRARKGVGYLPQDRSIFSKLTVKENVLAILETFPLSREEQLKRVDTLLDELGIFHLQSQNAGLLSGGERRRLEIARSLATAPTFMLLDEPFAGIDPLAVIDLKKIIGLLKTRGIGVLISDHNVRETLGVCDTAYLLCDGEVLESGPPAKIAASETACRVYLGNEFRL